MQRPARPFTSRPPKPVSRPVKIAFAAGGLVLSAATLGLVLYEVSGGFAPSRSAATSSSLPLSPSHFTPVQVVSSEKSDSLGQHKLIKLKLAKELTPPSSTVAPVFSVYLKDSDIQVERAYTPLKGLDENGEMLFWVKRYEHGEVGRWFHRQKVGEQVEIRGPMRTLDWEDGKWDEVVLVRAEVLHDAITSLRCRPFRARFREGQELLHFTSFFTMCSLERGIKSPLQKRFLCLVTRTSHLCTLLAPSRGYRRRSSWMIFKNGQGIIRIDYPFASMWTRRKAIQAPRGTFDQGELMRKPSKTSGNSVNW